MDISQNLSALMNEAQKMQKRMQDAQKQLSELVVTGESGGGMVTVTMNGQHEVLSVKLKHSISILEEETEFVEDLIMAAVNKAVREVEKISKEKISQLTAGLNIPAEFMPKDKEGEGDKGKGG